MEKFIYFLEKDDAISIDQLRDKLTTSVVAELRTLGASQITVNVADLNQQIGDAAPGRLIGPWQHVAAAVSFWHQCLDHRAPIEALLLAQGKAITGYLVTESIPQTFEPDWEGGARRPGVTQFGANGKPANVTEEEFYHNWQVDHSTLSFDLHPLRWSYVRNAVARPLTTDAPAYRAIVSEHFREIDDFTDDSRYFGSMEVLQKMIAEVPGFCDAELMFSVPMSEYFFS